MSTSREPRRGRLLFVAANPSIDRLYEVDRMEIGAIHRPLAALSVAGGKGLNAARAAAAVGGSVRAVGILAGRSGDWIAERLVELGIDGRWARSGGETRTCVSILDRSSGAMTEIYEHGQEIDPGAWLALEAIVREELDRAGVVAIALSGSLPPGAPPDGYARIARLAADSAAPVPVLADTYGPALRAVLAERPAVVKLNAAEAGEASGVRIADIASAAGAAGVLREAGAERVVITLGPDGALAARPDGLVHLIPPDVRGSYPVGSGDAFLGGLAVGWQRGDSFVEAARLGLAAAIANAQVPGAGRLDPGAVDDIRGRIVVSPV